MATNIVKRAGIVAAMACAFVQLAVARPVAEFTTTTTSGCSPLKVQFTNASTNGKKFQWFFGNGNSSSLFHPAAVYNKPGKYSVSLIVTDSLGFSDTLIRENYITVFASPVAFFNSDKQSVCKDEYIQFNDKTTLGNGSLTYWVWDFGDGGFGYGKKPTHQFKSSGIFDVALSVKDTNGCESMLKLKSYINVKAAPEMNVTSANNKLCTAPAVVDFNANVVASGKYSCNWWFGDGDSLLGSSKVQHTYQSGGKYGLKVLVTDEYGCKSVKSYADFVQIAPPTADFKVADSVICLGSKAYFENHSAPRNGRGNFSWDFGDGNTTTIENPWYEYKKPGVYTVTLRYFWEGCTAQVVRSNAIRVLPAPYLKINPSDTAICRQIGKKLRLTFQSEDDFKVQWQRTDKLISGADTASSFFLPIDTNGVYRIRIEGVSMNGCGNVKDSVLVTVRGPFAGLSMSKSSGCLPYNSTVKFNGFSAAPIVKYEWYYQKESSVGTSPEFSLVNSKFGVSRIYLKITDENGCKDSLYDFLAAGIKVKSVFEIEKYTICSNEELKVFNLSPVQSPDTVVFLYSWFGKDTIPLPFGDTVKIKFRTNPSENVKLSFTASSFGCGSQDVKTIKVLGPYLKGIVNSSCEKDSVFGQNLSTDYTSSFWRVYRKDSTVEDDTEKNFAESIPKMNHLWLYAFNSNSHCSDSIEMPIKIDPQTPRFTIELNCIKGLISTHNEYKGLTDSMFLWFVKSLDNGKVVTYRARHLKDVAINPGYYEISLQVLNAKFDCTPAAKMKLRVNAIAGMKPAVSLDRSNCFPVTITMKDGYRSFWRNADWKIDNKWILKDSVDEIVKSIESNSRNLLIYLFKTDSAGCSYTDTFSFAVGGSKAAISFSQSNADCLRPVLTFGAQNGHVVSGMKYTYEWDFGYRKSSKVVDTMIVPGSKVVNVSLKITDSTGCSSLDYKTINVKKGKPFADLRVISDTLVDCPPLHVRFADSSKSEFGPLTFRHWDFGDSSYSGLQSPGKLYLIPGSYGVILVVGNSSGCRDTVSVPDMVVVKGPSVAYSFDKLVGCEPHTVALSARVKGNVARFEFDMGDGVVYNQQTDKHIFAQAGEYIPRLMVTDSNGCSYSPLPTDTIVVHHSPRASFESGNYCLNSNIVVNHSSSSVDSIVEVNWFLNNKRISVNHQLELEGKFAGSWPVSLSISTVHQCSDSTSGNIRVYGTYPSFSVQKQEHCLGDVIRINDNSAADTTVASRLLYVANKPVGSSLPFLYKANERGKLDAELHVTDVLGCTSVLKLIDFLRVGDTIAPSEASIYYTTVVDNSQTETKFSLSGLTDFKSYNFYVAGPTGWKLEETKLNLNDTIAFAKGLNTLQNSYCHAITQTNFCGKETELTSVKPHCTIETKAFGDTNAVHVSWQPYAGWQSVEKYYILRKESSESNFSIVDSVKGTQTQFTDYGVYCHKEYDYKIKAAGVNNGIQYSFSDSSRAKPIHFMPFAAPEVWRTTVENDELVLTEWLPTSNHKYPVQEFYLYGKNENGNWDLKKTIAPELFSFRDKAVQVDEKSYLYAVAAKDVCGTISPVSEPGKSILLNVKTDGENQYPVLDWSEYIYWNEGVEAYDVERSLNGEEFVTIGETSSENRSFVDKTVPATCIKYVKYRVVAKRAQPLYVSDSVLNVVSVSNEVDFTPEIRFYIPNAFTPDANNLNETFHPTGMYYKSYRLKIYNRYGEKLFDVEGCNPSWDGIYMGQPVMEGIYVYEVEALDYSQKNYVFSGSIQVLK